jgi:predicted permease
VQLGRFLEAEDYPPGAAARVILRQGFWQAQFAGDRGIIGRTIEVDGQPHVVIGVLPADLEFPPPARRSSGSMPRQTDLWTGTGRLDDLYERGGFFAIARLASGRTASDAMRELTGLANGWRAAGTDSLRVPVESVTETVLAPLRPAVLAFAGGVALVLLIACANLGSLLLARLAGRERELALRLSLGARRGRIARQVLTEGGVIAAAGMVAGLGVAWLVLRSLLVLAPAELVRVQQATLNARVLVFALLVSMLTTVLIGLLPALRSMRRDPREALSGARSGMDRSTGRAHAALVAAEVAFAVVLLVEGGLLVRSFAALASVDPGFPSRGLITADLLIPPDRYPTRQAVLQFFERLETRLGAQVGVGAVSAIDRLPYGPSFSQIGFRIVGRAQSAGAGAQLGYNTSARPGYFRTLGIPVLQGREFTAADGPDSQPVVVIARSLADRYWPGSTAVGERIEVFGESREIVGVVGDVRHFGPSTPVDPLIYLPQAQDVTTRRMMTVVVRSAEGLAFSPAAMRAEIRALDAQLPISNLRSFDALRSERTASQRFNAMLIASFALLAVTLAGVGIYGVTSFVVAQRRREIGVRMAIGASGASVLRRFVGQALRSVAVGVLAGTLAALPLARLTRSLFYGVPATDPLTYAGVIALVSVLGLLAAALPARRAAGIAPRTALAND